MIRALLAILDLFATILRIAREQGEAKGRADVIEQTAQQAKRAIEAAQQARNASRTRTADPDRVRDDDGFRRPD